MECALTCVPYCRMMYSCCRELPLGRVVFRGRGNNKYTIYFYKGTKTGLTFTQIDAEAL